MAFRRFTENIEHLLPQFADVAGKYDIPVIEPVELPFLDEWVPFNDLSKPFTKSQGVHMFVDDYRMVRCWNNLPAISKPSSVQVRCCPLTTAYTPIPRPPLICTTITVSIGLGSIGRKTGSM